MLWVANKIVPHSNGMFFNFNKTIYEATLNCPISKFYHPLEILAPFNTFCVELNYKQYSLASKPWQCQIQVDVLLPKYVFDVGKHTQIFSLLEIADTSLPKSSMPTFNIFVDSKSTFEEYDINSLVFWITKSSSTFIEFGFVITDSHSIFHAVCPAVCPAVSSVCFLDTLPYCHINLFTNVMPCLSCPSLVRPTKISYANLSIQYVMWLDKGTENDVFVGKIVSDTDNHNNGFRIGEQVTHFLELLHTELSKPLQNFHEMKVVDPDPKRMLAFAYAAIFYFCLGNLTFTIPSGWVLPKGVEKNTIFYERSGYIEVLEHRSISARLEIHNQ